MKQKNLFLTAPLENVGNNLWTIGVMVSFSPPAISILRLVDLLSLPRYRQTFSLWSLNSLSHTHPTTFTHAPCPAHCTQKILKTKKTLVHRLTTWLGRKARHIRPLYTIRCFNAVVPINKRSSLNKAKQCTMQTTVYNRVSERNSLIDLMPVTSLLLRLRRATLCRSRQSVGGTCFRITLVSLVFLLTKFYHKLIMSSTR